jgi:Tol biopolymer transport system component
LKIVPLLGDRPIVVNPASGEAGFVWVNNTQIVHSDITRKRLLLVNVDDGGTFTEVAAIDSSNSLARIAAHDVLPDGRILANSSVDGRNYDLIAIDLDSGVQTPVMKDDAFFVRYVLSGHLLYSPDGNQMMARRFNPSSLAFSGPTIELYPTTLERSFAVSKNGRFVTLDEEHWGRRELVRVDRNGRTQVISAPKLDYEEVSVDPTSSRVVVEVNQYESREDQAVIIDLNNPEQIQQITFGTAGAYEPIWTSDGEKIVFSGISSSVIGPGTRILSINSSGIGERSTIIVEPENVGFTALSSDDSLVAYADVAAPLGRFVGIYSIEAQQEVRRWAEPGISYGFPEFSPDDRFIVYNRAAGGITDIWISEIDTEYSRPVTTNGGEMPKFSADGKFLYYYRDQALYELPVDLTDEFKPTGSEKLVYSADAHFYFDVIPDGSGFILSLSLGEDPYGVVTVIDGFFELLQNRIER